jgi:hypothetical protein
MELTPPARRSRNLTPRQQHVREWVQKNYGLLSSIARKYEVSVVMVHAVAYGRSKSSKIEKKLRALGCPAVF